MAIIKTRFSRICRNCSIKFTPPTKYSRCCIVCQDTLKRNFAFNRARLHIRHITRKGLNNLNMTNNKRFT